jgi:hypothetical protein
MATEVLTHTKQYNHSRYLLLPTIGLNYQVLGENFQDCYISRNTNDYHVYIVVTEECFILDNHKMLVGTVYHDSIDCYIYKMEIPVTYNSDLRAIRNGKTATISKDLIELCKIASGLPSKLRSVDLSYFIFDEGDTSDYIFRMFHKFVKTVGLVGDIWEMATFNKKNIGNIQTYDKLEEVQAHKLALKRQGKDWKKEAEKIKDCYIGEPIITRETEFIEYVLENNT